MKIVRIVIFKPLYTMHRIIEMFVDFVWDQMEKYEKERDERHAK